MKREKVWKVNMVLWSITLVVSAVGIGLWVKEYLTMGEADWAPIFFFVCASFSAVVWMIVYRREKRKEKQ